MFKFYQHRYISALRLSPPIPSDKSPQRLVDVAHRRKGVDPRTYNNSPTQQWLRVAHQLQHSNYYRQNQHIRHTGSAAVCERLRMSSTGPVCLCLQLFAAVDWTEDEQ